MLGASVSTLLSVHKTVGDAVGEGEGSGGEEGRVAERRTPDLVDFFHLYPHYFQVCVKVSVL